MVQISAEILVVDLTSPRSGVIVLADAANTLDRALVSNGRKNCLRIWVVNPEGQLLQVSSFENQHSYLQSLEDAEVILTSDLELATAAREYFEDRFFGSEGVDFDSCHAAKGLDKIP